MESPKTKQGHALRSFLFPDEVASERSITEGISSHRPTVDSTLLQQSIASTKLIFEHPALAASANAPANNASNKHSSLPPLRTVMTSHRPNQRSTANTHFVSVAETFPLPLLQRFQGLDVNARIEEQRRLRRIREEQEALLAKKKQEEEEKARQAAAEKLAAIPKIDSIYDDEDVDAKPYELFQQPIAETKKEPVTTEKATLVKAVAAAAAVVPANYVAIVVFDEEMAAVSTATTRKSRFGSAATTASAAAVAPSSTTDTAPAPASTSIITPPSAAAAAAAAADEGTKIAEVLVKFVRPLRPLPLLRNAHHSAAAASNNNKNNNSNNNNTAEEPRLTVQETVTRDRDPVVSIWQRYQQVRQHQLLSHTSSQQQQQQQRKVAGIIGAQNIASAIATLSAHDSNQHQQQQSSKQIIHRDIFGVSSDVQKEEAAQQKAKRLRSKQGESFGKISDHEDDDDEDDEEGGSSKRRVVEEEEEGEEDEFDGISGNDPSRSSRRARDEDDNEQEKQDKKRYRFLSESLRMLGKDAVLFYGDGDDSDVDGYGSDGDGKAKGAAAGGGGGGKKRFAGGGGGGNKSKRMKTT